MDFDFFTYEDIPGKTINIHLHGCRVFGQNNFGDEENIERYKGHLTAAAARAYADAYVALHPSFTVHECTLCNP